MTGDALRTQLAEVLRAVLLAPVADEFAGRLLPIVAAHAAASRAEGAAEALRDAADDWIRLAAHSPKRLLPSDARKFIADRASALSAPTTTEGDPT